MSVEPYETGFVNRETLKLIKKRCVVGELVEISGASAPRPGVEKRELRLMIPLTRVVCVNQIHELSMTDEQDAGPGKIVNSVAILGFAEIRIGGLIKLGDEVSVFSKIIGEIAGFNEDHMPNHLNILIKGKRKYTGTRMRLQIGDLVRI